MGACGSSSLPPAGYAGVGEVTEGKGGVCARPCKVMDEAIEVGSEMDLTRTPNSEKKIGSLNLPADAETTALGFACRKGRKPGSRQPNQDSWCVHRVPGKLSAYCVFDGHGEKGHLISDYVKQLLPKRILQIMQNEKEGVADKLKASFTSMHTNVACRPHLGCQQSGTTATVVVQDHEAKKLTISHVGDSTAVLVSRKVGTVTHELEGAALTRDHKPNLKDEKERIEASGGRITFDGYCHRVVKKHGAGPGLNMSRSLGDAVAHKVCGVTAQAEVSTVKLVAEDHALLVATDGIWEVISPQEAAHLIKDFGPWQAMAAAKLLADEAVKRWMRGTNNQMTDDITVVVAFLQPQPSVLARAESGSTTAPSSATSSPAWPDSSRDLLERNNSWNGSIQDSIASCDDQRSP